jgi:hypothetical protein
MAEGSQQQQQQQQQQLNPLQSLALAVDRIRRVQNHVELNQPGQRQIIVMLREAGDLVWGEIERVQQAQQQQQQQQAQQQQ